MSPREWLQWAHSLGDIAPYGRGHGVVWHDTRHSAVTNLVNAGIPEPVAMSVTGHADASVFKRYNVRRDAVQVDALARLNGYLAAQRADTPASGHDTRSRHTTRRAQRVDFTVPPA